MPLRPHPVSTPARTYVLPYILLHMLPHGTEYTLTTMRKFAARRVMATYMDRTNATLGGGLHHVTAVHSMYAAGDETVDYPINADGTVNSVRCSISALYRHRRRHG